MRITNAIVFLLVFITYNLTAQSEKLINDAKSLFQKNISNVELYGYFDEENEVQFYLAYDEDEWKGYCYYPSGGSRIYVEGGIVRNNLILDEIDSSNTKIGMWMIGIDQIDHPAKWRDVSGKMSYDLILRRLNEANKALEYRHSFSGIYEGTIDENNYQLKVYINGGKKLRTSLMNYGRMFIYPSVTDCIDPECTKYRLTIDSEEGIKSITFSPESHKLIKATVKYKNGSEKEVNFNETGFFPFREVTYMTNLYRIYMTYPSSRIQNFNDTIARDINTILDSIKSELDQCVLNENQSETRLNAYANGWFDLGLISDEIYSGVLTVQSDCSDKIHSYPMVYNMKTGQKINFIDQFTEGFNIKFFFSQYLKEKIKKIPELKTPIFKNHLKPESFRNIYVSEQGIVFATDFNTILGSQKIILPFSDLKGVIKRKSPLKKMVNE